MVIWYDEYDGNISSAIEDCRQKMIAECKEGHAEGDNNIAAPAKQHAEIEPEEENADDEVRYLFRLHDS